MKFNNLYTDKILNDNNNDDNDDMVVCIWNNSILIDSVNGCEGKWWIYKNERINKQWLYYMYGILYIWYYCFWYIDLIIITTINIYYYIFSSFVMNVKIIIIFVVVEMAIIYLFTDVIYTYNIK